MTKNKPNTTATPNPSNKKPSHHWAYSWFARCKCERIPIMAKLNWWCALIRVFDVRFRKLIFGGRRNAANSLWLYSDRSCQNGPWDDLVEWMWREHIRRCEGKFKFVKSFGVSICKQGGQTILCGFLLNGTKVCVRCQLWLMCLVVITSLSCDHVIEGGGSGANLTTQVRFMVEPLFIKRSGPPCISVIGSAN